MPQAIRRAIDGESDIVTPTRRKQGRVRSRIAVRLPGEV